MTEANKELLIKIRSLKEEHPAWGYRRAWAYLKYRKDLPINLQINERKWFISA